jgi:multifunctional beta-oxidation protein
MSQSVMPSEVSELIKPDYVAPLVLLLCSDKLPNPTGNLYEVGGGRVSQTRWIRSGGYAFPTGGNLTPEQVLHKWDLVTAFDERADHPWSPEEGAKRIMATVERQVSFSFALELRETFTSVLTVLQNAPPSNAENSTQGYLEGIKAAIAGPSKTSRFTYTDRDVMLYNIGVGAKHDQMPFV